MCDMCDMCEYGSANNISVKELLRRCNAFRNDGRSEQAVLFCEKILSNYCSEFMDTLHGRIHYAVFMFDIVLRY